MLAEGFLMPADRINGKIVKTVLIHLEKTISGNEEAFAVVGSTLFCRIDISLV